LLKMRIRDDLLWAWRKTAIWVMKMFKHTNTHLATTLKLSSMKCCGTLLTSFFFSWKWVPVIAHLAENFFFVFHPSLGNMHKNNQQTLEKSEVFQLLEHNWGWNSVVTNLVHLHLCI
jgi:hypothetical protein